MSNIESRPTEVNHDTSVLFAPGPLLIPVAPHNVTFDDPRNAGKVPAVIDSAGTWHRLTSWQRGGIDADTIERCREAGGNTGLITGRPHLSVSAVAVDLDLDPEKGDDEARRELQTKRRDDFIARLPDLFECRNLAARETVPWRGLIIAWIPTLDPIQKFVIPLHEEDGTSFGKIELLATGQQCVVGGTHQSGRPIVWRTITRPEECAPLPSMLSGALVSTYAELADRLKNLLDALGWSHGGRSTSSARGGGRSTVGDSSAAKCAPAYVTADTLIGLIDRCQNPATIDRDIYDAFMHGVAAVMHGVGAHRRLQTGDERRIGEAAARWAARWESPTRGSYEAELAKWENDYRKLPHGGFTTSWGRLCMIAQQKLGVPEIVDENAAAEFKAEARPKDDTEERFKLWPSLLDRNAHLTPLPTMLNAFKAFRHAPEFAGVLRWNAFSLTAEITKRPPWLQHGEDYHPGQSLRDIDVLRAQRWLQTNLIRVGKEITFDGLLMEARRHSYHPVRDYLEGLQWDGTERLDRWLIDHLGAEDTPLNCELAKNALIAAVARAMDPGCKNDDMLILEGEQGIGKSTAFNILAGSWFSDELPEIGTKDCAINLQGVWIQEVAELDGFSRASTKTLKAFLSRRVDRYRAPYDRIAADHPRQCIIVGSINPEAGGYLTDATGNRRYRSVACGAGWEHGRRVDLDALKAVRDQLWGEARVRYGRGEAWWIVNAELEREAEAAADARYAEDVWTGPILAYLGDRETVSKDDLLGSCLGVPKERWNRAQEMRVSGILKRAGWEKRREGGGGRGYRYLRPANDPLPVRDNVVPLRHENGSESPLAGLMGSAGLDHT